MKMLKRKDDFPCKCKSLPGLTSGGVNYSFETEEMKKKKTKEEEKKKKNM